MSDETKAGTPKLNAALKAAQAAMAPVSKGAINPAFKDAANPAKAKGTPYADFEDIVTATKPHLVANGIAVTQEPMDAPEGWVKVRTVLLHDSGEERSGTLSLPCVSKTPQAYGSALSYAKRYSYQAMTGAVAKGEDDDGNASSGKPEATARRDAKPPAPPKATADELETAKTAARAAFAIAKTQAELEAAWNTRVKGMPKPDRDELTPPYVAQQQALRAKPQQEVQAKS